MPRYADRGQALGSTLWLSAALLSGCPLNPPPEISGRSGPAPAESEQERMIEEQIVARGVRTPRVLDALRRVPRAAFVPPALAAEAHRDSPLPIGHGQTISQPFIVAYMTDQLDLSGDEKVLEIGTGSGYQAAILGELARRVYTIEIVEPLARQSRELLERQGFENIEVRTGDGYRGWPEQAPFDVIVLTAAPPEIPQPLIDQLAVGGRLLAPVGRGHQDLVLIRRDEEGIHHERLIGVRFVPMVGKARNPETSP